MLFKLFTNKIDLNKIYLIYITNIMSVSVVSVNDSSEKIKIEKAKIARRKWRENNRQYEKEYQLNVYHSKYKTDDHYRKCRRSREKLRYYNVTIKNLQNKEILSSRDKMRIENLMALREILLTSHSEFLPCKNETDSN